MPRSNDTKSQSVSKIKFREVFHHHLYLFVHIFHLTVSINKQSLFMVPANFKLNINLKAPTKTETQVFALVLDACI